MADYGNKRELFDVYEFPFVFLLNRNQSHRDKPVRYLTNGSLIRLIIPDRHRNPVYRSRQAGTQSSHAGQDDVPQ